MKRFKYLTLAALVAFAACDEGEDPPPPDVEVTGSITGVVTIEGTGRSGVTVTLSSGTTATTDAVGAYTFTNVPAGAYTVTISGFPSDATFSAAAKAAAITTAGQVATVNFDGAYIRTSVIVGSVSAGGSGLSGVAVAISGQSAASTTTNANGQFSFSGLRAGNYSVTMTNPNSGMYAFPTTQQSVSLAVGASQAVSFEGTLLQTAKIAGRLYIDEAPKNNNYDGALLEANLAVANIAITIEGGAVNSTTTAQTAADGTFEFTGLAAGTYRVSIDNTDADIPTNVAFGLASNETIVTVSVGATATVNWPFDITRQAVKVGAFLGTDGSNPLTAPIKGWAIDLYDTQANAAAGGATGRIGTGSTAADGYLTFRFTRASDVGPNSAANDRVVFARSVNPPTNHAPNGETILEIQYPATDSMTTGDDVFDAFNNQVVIGVKATELDGDILAGWSAVLRNNKDSTFATIAQQATTNASGIRYFTVAGPLNVYPDTLWVRLADGQAGANGHAFRQAPTADEGGAFNRSLRYIWSGLTPATDTIMLGTEVVTYQDVNVTMRAHHEVDDSTDTPVRTAGDNFDAVPNIDLELKRGSTVVGARTAAAAGTGLVTWANVAIGDVTAYAYSNSPSIDVLDNKTIAFTLDGSDQTYTDQTLRGSATSSFAYKFNNNTVSGTLSANDGTAAAGVRVRIMAHPDNIQPNAAKDTTVKTNAAGLYTTGAKVREGPYIAMAFDSVTSGGDSIWAMLGADTDTADAQGSLHNAIMNFGATRMDTKIQGVVVNDRDSDFNTLDPDEALSGVTIDLLNDLDNDGVFDANEATAIRATTTTDATGAYSFTKLREGRYHVRATSPANATVLRALSGTGGVTAFVSVRTQAAAGANPGPSGLCAAADCRNQNLTRTVGTTNPPGQNDEFPRWNYLTGAAFAGGAGVAAGGPNQNNGALTTAPTHFVHLFSTGTLTGKVVQTAAPTVGVAGVTVTVTRCFTAGTAPSPPVAGACTAKEGSPTPNFFNQATNASGVYTFTNLLEGVYQIDVAPATAGYTNIDAPAAGSYLATLAGNLDVETAPNFTIS